MSVVSMASIAIAPMEVRMGWLLRTERMERFFGTGWTESFFTADWVVRVFFVGERLGVGIKSILPFNLRF